MQDLTINEVMMFVLFGLSAVLAIILAAVMVHSESISRSCKNISDIMMDIRAAMAAELAGEETAAEKKTGAITLGGLLTEEKKKDDVLVSEKPHVNKKLSRQYR